MCLIGEQAIVIALGLILAVEAYDYRPVTRPVKGFFVTTHGLANHATATRQKVTTVIKQ